MSDDVTRGLLNTDDAMVWSQEFCRIFDGFLVNTDDRDAGRGLGPGTMVGWFANAMQIGEQFFRQGHVVTAHLRDDGQIVIDGPLPEEILISRQILLDMIKRHNESIAQEDEPSLEEKFMEGFNEGRFDYGPQFGEEEE